MNAHMASPMLEALAATGPAPGFESRLALFGQFIGSWELDRTEYTPDGRVATVHRGEWHFGWVLDGRAIQDVWICPARGMPDSIGDWPGEWGTVIRFYDQAIDAWRVTWLGPRTAAVETFIGKAVGSEIVQLAKGTQMRWIFSEMIPEGRPSRFRWRSEVSDDGGATWRITIEMAVRRAVRT
jgi:hypothetical protein